MTMKNYAIGNAYISEGFEHDTNEVPTSISIPSRLKRQTNLHQKRKESTNSHNNAISNAFVKDLDSGCSRHVKGVALSDKQRTMQRTKQFDKRNLAGIYTPKAFILTQS